MQRPHLALSLPLFLLACDGSTGSSPQIEEAFATPVGVGPAIEAQSAGLALSGSLSPIAPAGQTLSSPQYTLVITNSADAGGTR